MGFNQLFYRAQCPAYTLFNQASQIPAICMHISTPSGACPVGECRKRINGSIVHDLESAITMLNSHTTLMTMQSKGHWQLDCYRSIGVSRYHRAAWKDRDRQIPFLILLSLPRFPTSLALSRPQFYLSYPSNSPCFQARRLVQSVAHQKFQLVETSLRNQFKSNNINIYRHKILIISLEAHPILTAHSVFF